MLLGIIFKVLYGHLREQLFNIKACDCDRLRDAISLAKGVELSIVFSYIREMIGRKNVSILY